MTFVAALSLSAFWLSGCFAPDPRHVDGALARARQAVDRRDALALYKVIDERARHAMISIVNDGRASAARIREAYPERERALALAELGDTGRAESAAELFAARCTEACMAAFDEALGVPVRTRKQGRLSHVTTARGAELTLYLGSDTWHGLEWHTAALSRERDRAAAQREVVERNAALYETRRKLVY